MGTYISIFLFEFISVYILWFIFRKLLKINKNIIMVLCLTLSLVTGYIAAYRMIGYEVTIDYLTRMNNQNIETSGKSITIEEENKYKEELFGSEEFKPYLIENALKVSLPPFALVLIVVFFSIRKTNKNITLNQV